MEVKNDQYKNEILYLCDGNVKDCPKSRCYKCAGPCHYTTDESNSLYSGVNQFFYDDNVNVWEISPEVAHTLRLHNPNVKIIEQNNTKNKEEK